jgi:shikimate kinase
MKIFLIGMPGSGKTTIGNQLAAALSYPFIDLDAEIEKEEGKSIKEIFSEKGEDYFRLAESNALKKSAVFFDSFVLSTGGGAPCFHNGIDIINKSGISIFLDVPVEELLVRVGITADRPLLQTDNDEKHIELKQKLQSILNDRLAIYQQARYTITEPTLQKVMAVLRK